MVKKEGRGGCPVSSMTHQRSSRNVGWMNERMSEQMRKLIHCFLKGGVNITSNIQGTF